MAAISSISVAPMAKTLHSNRTQKLLPISFLKSRAFSRPFLFSSKRLRIQAAQSSASTVEEEQKLEKDKRSEEDEQEAMSIENLKQFVELNLGKWNGTFYQFDSHGNLMQKVNTKLSASSYGESELISLIQTLYIKQPQSNTSVSGDDPEAAAEWVEYKIKESNMFTVDKYQQISFFPIEKAFSLRYQTAGMLESVLRQGVLGEDDTEEESPKNLKLPSLKPSIVCENCLYSQEKDMRVRAFHILDPKGVLEMLLVFLEERDVLPTPPLLANSEDNGSRIAPFLGRWKGHSITKRSGVYGATIAETEIDALLELDDKGQLIQDITSTVSGTDITTNVHWTGTVSDNLVVFDGGFQMTLLPGGIYMACPCDISKNVTDEKAFHLEFCWLESPGNRQRLIRTYDLDGLAVSSTYISESKIEGEPQIHCFFSSISNNNEEKAERQRIFNSKAKNLCWAKAEVVPGRHPDRWRKDAVGNIVCKRFWNCHGCLCFEYDHIVPFSKGGESTAENCQILQSRVNRFKADKESVDKSELKGFSCDLQFTDKELDIIEMAVYGDVIRPGNQCRCRTIAEMLGQYRSKNGMAACELPYKKES